uniref:RNA polymerase beta'' subunit n=1 Tax=Anemia phyllitidis TaxID=12940 RepID=UPI0021ABD6F6|nr:RNA polymerase beta'' subunit [Anemia phyllitidis]UUL71063.1 RNA polymerase beta'' subunit [Anemia phyllitidis]
MADQVELPFYNKTMDKTAVRQLISKLTVHFGIAYATNILDQIKILGFQQATKASVSSGIDDLSTVPFKGWLVQDAERQGYVPDQYHRYGSLHAVEKLRQSIEAWYATSECLKREMNPSFRMIDPLNPVHMMSFSGARGSISQVHQLLGMRGPMSDPRGQVIDLPIRRNLREGLSLTEYIISCYGARKGVVDTAVRTSDAGYLTRRLVEVAQHIVVREKDCGTIKSIARNIIEGRRESIRTVSQQRLVGRVLADNAYLNKRCVAARNQDIDDKLASDLVSAIQPIHIRPPSTCRTIFWICQLCHGWSLAHHDLVELGEAVGIIAGQSIGEPGTQSTSRTFHTGGVFTGDIAEYVRTPFNGLVNFDEGSVCPTRTRHGHPAWMCWNELSILIKSLNDTNNIVIPARSLLMIRNNQYVESQQIIAEVRAKEFPLKERIQKSIYPNLEGEMHWSRLVCHSHKRVNETIHVVRDTGHIRIFSGTFNDSDRNYLFHQDQDKINARSYLEVGKQDCSKMGQLVIEMGQQIPSKNLHVQKIETSFKCFPNWFNSLASTFVVSGFVANRGEEGDRSFSSLNWERDNDESFLTNTNLHLLGNNSILNRKKILAIFESYEHRTNVSGVLKYGTIRVEPIDEMKYVSGYETSNASFPRSRYRVIKRGNSFLIPEELYATQDPLSSVYVMNNSFVEEGTRLTPNIISQVSGSVRIRKIQSSTETRILPGYIHHPKNTEEITNLSKEKDTLLPPGDNTFSDLKSENWICLRLVTSRRGKTSVLVRPVVEYKISDDSSVQTRYPRETPETSKCAEPQSFTYVLYGNDEYVKISNEKTSTQLVQTCLVVNWREHLSHFSFRERAYVSLTNVVTYAFSNTFLQIGSSHILPTMLGDSNIFEQLVLPDNYSPMRSDLFNRNGLLVKYQSTIHSVFERGASFLILSPFNLFRNILCNTATNHKETVKDSISTGENSAKCKNYLALLKIRLRLLDIEEFDLIFSPKKNEDLGLLGQFLSLPIHLFHLHSNFAPVGKVPNYLVDDLTHASEHKNWYSIDENERVIKYYSTSSSRRYLFNKRNFLLSHAFFKNIASIKLGLLIGENRYLFNDNTCPQSGQVVAIHKEYLFIRTGKPYSANQGTTIHKDTGDVIGEGDTSITLPYDRLRSGDTIQGSPKVEQPLESRSIGSIPTRIEYVFERWSKGIFRLIGHLWSHVLGAGASMEHCQSVLIDQIRKVYGSQGVQVSDKHIEIIIRQLTSKVISLEDGVTNVFLPGELIGPSQAQRINRLLKKSIAYEPIVLGMTKASLNTTSFLSEASFQETTRVPARAAPRGRTDWLKGLKENVILGDVVPIGTGSQEIFHKRNVKKQRELLVTAKTIDIFNTDRSILPNYEVDPSFRYKPVIHEGLKHISSGTDTDN